MDGATTGIGRYAVRLYGSARNGRSTVGFPARTAAGG